MAKLTKAQRKDLAELIESHSLSVVYVRQANNEKDRRFYYAMEVLDTLRLADEFGIELGTLEDCRTWAKEHNLRTYDWFNDTYEPVA